MTVYIYKSIYTKVYIQKRKQKTPGTFVEEKTNQCRKKEGETGKNSLKGGGGFHYLGVEIFP